MFTNSETKSADAALVMDQMAQQYFETHTLVWRQHLEPYQVKQYQMAIFAELFIQKSAFCSYTFSQ